MGSEFKTRASSPPLKTKTISVKNGQSLRQLKTSSGNTRFQSKDTAGRFNKRRDVLAYKMKAAGKFSSKALKTTAVAGGMAAAGKIRSDIGEVSENTQDTESMLRLSGQELRKYTFQVAKLPPGLARRKLEKKLLGDKVKEPVRTGTAFSPFQIRRKMYDKAYKKKRFDKRLMRVKSHYGKAKTAAAVARRQAAAAQKGTTSTTRAAGSIARRTTSAVMHLIRGASTLARMAVGSIASLLPWIAAIGLPILIIVAIVVAAGPANDAKENGGGMLTVITAEGTVTSDTVDLTLYGDDGKVILSFKVTNNEGRFIYTKPAEGDKEATNLNGRIKGKRITLKGTLQGEPVSMEGKIKNGKAKLEGFWGEFAEEALKGDWQNPFGKVKYLITSEFGIRVHPITGEIRQHDGYDMCAVTGEGSDIYASKSGTVSVAGWYGGYGNCVVIDHGGGIQSLYGHMNAVKVRVGEKVRVGQKIGIEGNTGQSQGAHLHFEIRKNGTAVDGKKYLKTLYTNATGVDIWA